MNEIQNLLILKEKLTSPGYHLFNTHIRGINSIYSKKKLFKEESVNYRTKA